MASSQEVVSLLQWFTARYPNSNWPDATGKAWIDDLAEFPITDLRAAAIMWYRQGHEWPPNAGQLMASALDLAAGPESDWEDAWNAIWQHAKECRAVEFLCTHDLAEMLGADGYQALLAVGGYYNLMRTDVSTHPTIRAQFRDIYRTRTARARAAARQPETVTAMLEASRPAQIAPPPRAPVATVAPPPADANEIRPAPQNWKDGAGNRHAEYEAWVARVAAQKRGGVL